MSGLFGAPRELKWNNAVFKANIVMQVNWNNIFDKIIIGFANNDSAVCKLDYCYCVSLLPQKNSVGYLKEV